MSTQWKRKQLLLKKAAIDATEPPSRVSNEPIAPPLSIEGSFAISKSITPKTPTPKSVKPKPKSSVETAAKKTVTLTDEMKTRIREKAYLGKKGYTVLRETLDPEEYDFLKTELFVKPVVMGPQYGNAAAIAEEAAFPVYRENAKKMYIPRFYGIERYGLPTESEITQGDNINVCFAKPLRDYQENIIDVYMKYVNRPICALESDKNQVVEKGAGAILEVPCGRGKTVMALKIISLLKKKTLIIVHKEFLMNQWIERAAEFLPEAKIGKIQGPVFDIEGKDIVLGMLQTLYDRDFKENAFESFGLTVIDEVHRIGSEQFSKTLLRTITPYMLGISATVDRKDKLTKVLHMFIGPKIYTESRKDDDPVCVRAIEYISADPQFNEVEYDFRGNAKFSTMISKISEFGPRNDFIVRVLEDLLKENSRAQIMVLCHNRSMLTYLHDAIVHRGFATTGYYVGGMKQAKLQETENKQIVLATYAMAAEALDIKTLSILLMASPKTDIIQSVGRILRVKHENPVVVDIVDRHELFQHQWFKRRAFYKKCNYRIRSIDSIRYNGMGLDWKTDKTWNRVFEPKVWCNTGEKDSAEENASKKSKCLVQLSDDDLLEHL
jgi:superfamily II DNA or RNA helicase